MSRRQNKTTVFSQAIETATAQANTIETNEQKEDDGSSQFSGVLKRVFADIPQKKKAQVRSLYLDDECYKRLEEMAKEQGISTSKALNEILKKIFEL